MPEVQRFTASIELSFAEKHLYDVIVVGAGPAGSSAAYHLARQGVDVLLVDRYTFPRDKCCGDALMPPALEELALMELADEVQSRYASAKNIAVSLYDLPTTQHLIDPSTHFSRSFIAPRADFDALLCNHALQYGASWLDNLVVHEMSEDADAEYIFVRGIRGERLVRLRCRIVIAADGSGSRLARQLRQRCIERGDMAPLTPPEDGRTRFTAMRGYFTQIEKLQDTLDFYFRADPGIHYYWMFPLQDGTANIGIIASLQQLHADHPDLAQSLETFLRVGEVRASHATLQSKLRAAPIASGMRGTALYGDHILCVGDAAALVHPVSAEGISEALTSGRLAAETSLVALKHKDFSQETLRPYGDAIRNLYQELYDGLIAGDFLTGPDPPLRPPQQYKKRSPCSPKGCRPTQKPCLSHIERTCYTSL